MSAKRNSMVSAASMLSLLCCTTQSASKFQLVEVRPGGEVTLLCPNFTSSPHLILWFRAVRRSEPRQISSIFNSDRPASASGEVKDKFETTSNLSNIFLKIKRVDLSDSGFYFCGFFMAKDPVISSATYLEVEDEWAKTTRLVCVLLGAFSIFLIIALGGLGILIKRLHTAQLHGTDCVSPHSPRPRADGLNTLVIFHIYDKKKVE